MMAVQRRRVAPERGEATKLHRDTVGSRIAKRRYQLGLTQDQIAALADRGRSAVAQWERDDCEPPLEILRKIADLLETTPQWRAFGGGDDAPAANSPEALGLVTVPEITFGATARERTILSHWGLPLEWLKNDVHVADVNKCVIFKVDYAACGCEYGDHVLVDLTAVRASPPGTFLHWDGIGPALATMTPQHGGGKPTVRVTGAGEPYEADPTSLAIIGRVRAVWRKG